jgi:serine phosphatase RsbU (regulator of sigma subunit)
MVGTTIKFQLISFPLSGRLKIRLALISCIVIVVSLFTSLLNSQKLSTDPNLIRAGLIDRNQLLELPTWLVTFQDCENRYNALNCNTVGIPDQEINFPDPAKIAMLVATLTPRPNTAIIRHIITDSERRWLDSKPDGTILILPRMVHDNTEDRTLPNAHRSAAGFGSSLNFRMIRTEILSKNQFILSIRFNDYNVFGPNDAPIALAEPGAAATYTNLSSLAVVSGFMGKQLDIGIPLLLTCIALILDHSRVFSALSILAVSRAIRFYQSYDYVLPERTIPFEIPMTAFGKTVIVPVAEPLVTFVNALTLALLIYFACQISHVSFRKKPVLLALLLLVISTTFGYFYNPQFAVRSDLWSDVIGCVLALPIVGYGVRLHLTKSEEFENALEKEMHRTASISSFLYWLRVILIGAVLLITAWVNLSDLIGLEASQFTESLNWAHSALLPTLIIAALLEIGSTTKKMRNFSQVMVAKALIDRDMQVGKEIQEHLLPVRRGNNAAWAWRAFYYPAITLAGDWFDIQPITFKDGKEFLLICLADVTGHGIGAALITTTISSHWSIWVDSLKELNGPETDEEREKLLIQAPDRVHRGLTALKRNSGCTAGFILLDNPQGRMTYCIAGHPGILTYKAGNPKMGFYFTPGTRPGFSGSDLNWEAKTTEIAQGEAIYLFSDGIVTPGEPVSKWLKSIQRGQKATGKSLSLTLLNSIRTNRVHFRKDRTHEDDMSLIILTKL